MQKKMNIGEVIVELARIDKKCNATSRYWLFSEVRQDGEFKARIYDRAADKTVAEVEPINIVTDEDGASKALRSVGYIEGFVDAMELAHKQHEKEREVEAAKAAYEKAARESSGDGQDEKPELNF